MTTPAEIDALLALEEGMTPGPWAFYVDEYAVKVDATYIPDQRLIAMVSTGSGAERKNGAAIAALPRLFTTLRALYARAIKAEAAITAARETADAEFKRYLRANDKWVAAEAERDAARAGAFEECARIADSFNSDGSGFQVASAIRAAAQASAMKECKQ